MEIIFELLFELFGDFLLAFVVEAFGSLFSSIRGRSAVDTGRSATTKPARAATGMSDGDTAESPRRGQRWPLRLVLGAALGALSLTLFPHSFAKTVDTRLAVLIGVPLACGLAMGAIGAQKRKRHQEAAAIDSFRNGFLFALPFVAVRFFFTT